MKNKQVLRLGNIVLTVQKLPKLVIRIRVIQEFTPLKQNKITVNYGNVAGAPTTKQKFHDRLVLSNRFQMLQPLVDKQEQEQQISQEFPASVHLVPGINSNAQKDKQCENMIHGANVVQVDDNKELLLAHQDKNILAGNKNKNGLFDGASQNVINASYQTWSAADNNTHEPDLTQVLTRNCGINSIEQANQTVAYSCSNQITQ